MVAVPRATQVIPGASVNIVLKADQRTGREVRGTVRDVLTKGDHYRGIKVRLTDGRIGRVQSIASGSPDVSSSPGDATSTSSSATPLGGQPSPANESTARGRGQHPRYRDVRLDEPPDAAAEQIDLGAYIVPSKRQGKGKGKGKKGPKNQPVDSAEVVETSQSSVPNAATDVTSASVTCPVCGNFEGDEAAVAHHVAEHFE